MKEPQGLGLSLSLYLVALIGGLLLFASPVYWLNAGTKLHNPGVAAYVPPPGATLIRKRDPNVMELSVLKHDDVVDATQLAAISAKSKSAQVAERQRRVVQRHRAPTDRYAAQPAPHGGFFFGLF
ncbi:MAG: hypothetical protein ACR2K5_02180 [Pseudolabrys sp.]